MIDRRGFVRGRECLSFSEPSCAHFLPPGVVCTTYLSHNRLRRGKKRLRQKVVLCNHM